MPELDLTVESDGATLAATLTLPDGPAPAGGTAPAGHPAQTGGTAPAGTAPAGHPTPAGHPVPALVVAHGASDPLRGAELYQHVAAAAAEVGVACLRYDRRGTGQSSGDPDATPHQLALDLAAAVAAVRRLAPVAPERVALWGHSQGAWLCALVAAADPAVAGVVAVSGSGPGPAQQMAHAVTTLLHDAGYSEHAVDQALRTRHALTRWTRDELDDASLASQLATAAAQPWAPLAFLPAAPEPHRKHVARAWAELDVVPALEQLRPPVLLVYGGADPWIDVPRSRATWRGRVASTDVTELLLDECAHKPTLTADRADWNERGPVHPRYDAALRRWLVRVLTP